LLPFALFRGIASSILGYDLVAAREQRNHNRARYRCQEVDGRVPIEPSLHLPEPGLKVCDPSLKGSATVTPKRWVGGDHRRHDGEQR
jgi:hypothetical protein